MQIAFESTGRQRACGSPAIFLAGCLTSVICGEAAVASAPREVVVSPLNSQLWRSEFQPGAMGTVSQPSAGQGADGSEIKPHDGTDQSSSKSARGHSDAAGHPAAPGLSEGALASLPFTTTPWQSEQEVSAGDADQNVARLSDWDQAAAFHRADSGSSGVKGPSLTTYLVAFAAAVVLLGTMLSPK